MAFIKFNAAAKERKLHLSNKQNKQELYEFYEYFYDLGL